MRLWLFAVMPPRNHNCYEIAGNIDESIEFNNNISTYTIRGDLMILYTGDTHGQTSRISLMIRRLKLGPADTIVICGDVGLNYYGNDRGDYERKWRLNREGVPILCIHGNHEQRPGTIPSYQIREWNEGKVYVEDDFPNLLFAIDGEVYNLGGHRAIAIGGAYSVDKYYRLARGLHWFEDEQPDAETKKRVEDKLEALDWKIDVVMSHTCPSRFVPTEAFLPGLDQATVDTSTEEWLDTIAQRLDYGKWFCGHWHIDKRVERFSFLMNLFDTYEGMEVTHNG